MHTCQQRSRSRSWCQQECSRLSAWLACSAAAEAVHEAAVARVQIRVARTPGERLQGCHVSHPPEIAWVLGSCCTLHVRPASPGHHEHSHLWASMLFSLWPISSCRSQAYARCCSVVRIESGHSHAAARVAFVQPLCLQISKGDPAVSRIAMEPALLSRKEVLVEPEDQRCCYWDRKLRTSLAVFCCTVMCVAVFWQLQIVSACDGSARKQL